MNQSGQRFAMYSPDAGATPRPAAALILCDRKRGGRLLFIKRNEKLAFMGGHHAFPGGRIDPEDAEITVLNSPGAEDAIFIAAAVRETFEEAGVLALGMNISHELPGPVRNALLEGSLSFADLLATHGTVIDAATLFPAGHWTTPTFSPLRYHTRYFFLEGDGFPDGSGLGCDGEIVDAEWMTAEEALLNWHDGALKTSTPVSFILRSLARLPREQALARMQRTPGSDPGTADFLEPRAGISVIPLNTTGTMAGYTLCSAVGWDDLAIIDPGTSDAEELHRLLARLDDFAAIGAHVRMILLTCGDPDHVGAADLLGNRFDVPVYADEKTAQTCPGLIDKILYDGDVVELSGHRPWRIHCTHVEGRCCYYEDSTGTAFLGDIPLGTPVPFKNLTMVVPAHGWVMPGSGLPQTSA